MKTRKLLSFACLAGFAMIYLPAEKLSAQTPTEALQVVFNYGGQNEARLPSRGGIVGAISLLPAQVMPFTLQFPSDRAGYPVLLGSLDGGRVSAIPPQDNPVVAADGTVRFSFQAGEAPGLYRLVVQLPGEQYHLNFYLDDLTHPRRGYVPATQP